MAQNRTKPPMPKTMIKREQMKPNHTKAVSGKATTTHHGKNLGTFLHPAKKK